MWFKKSMRIALVCLLCSISGAVLGFTDDEGLRPLHSETDVPATEIISAYEASKPLSLPKPLTKPHPHTFKQSNGQVQRWNLQDVDIKTVVEEVSRVTGKNFILDPGVSGRITMISSDDLDADETYQVFLSALQVLGYAAIPTGSVIKIVPDAQARHMDGFVDDGSATGDVVVARVIPIRYVSATQIVPTLRSMVSPQGHLAAYAPSNSLIIADHAMNAERIAKIVAKLDMEDADGMEIISLKYASASELVNALSQMLSQSKRGQENNPLSLSADDRTNSVIITGDKAKRLQVRAMIGQLDVELPEEGNTEVLYLKYQKAESLVPVLANILDSYASAAASRNNNNNGQGNTSTTHHESSQPKPFGTSKNLTGSNGSTGGGEMHAEKREAAGVVVGNYGVQAEPGTNALIVTAPPALMRNIKNVIARLDVRRAQVLVEAIIVEVTGNNSDQWGVEWRGAGDLAGGTTFPNEKSPGLINAYQATINKGTDFLPGAGLMMGFIRNGSLRFLLHSLQSDSSVNVLSTPSLIAMDNVAAEIKVGSGIPFQIGQYATTGGANTVTPFITTEYRDVGLNLKIVPQITSGDTVQLQIIQAVDSLGPMLNDNPTTHNREVATQVIVDSGDILVLGGLIQTEDKMNKSKVPILGDIPLLGKLFQSENTVREKTNLMIFIRPVIMRDATTNAMVTNSKYNSIRDIQILSQPHDVVEDPLMLPPWEYKDVNLPEPFDDKG